MQNYRYSFKLCTVYVVCACSGLDLHKCQVRGIVVDTTPIFYQIAKAFLIVAIYTLQFVKALQTLLSRSKSNRSVHMQFITWILLLERWRAFEATSELQYSNVLLDVINFTLYYGWPHLWVIWRESCVRIGYPSCPLGISHLDSTQEKHCAKATYKSRW